MGTNSSGWQHTAWAFAVRYWTFICLLAILLPAWVTYINREDDFSSGDQVGLVASLFPAAMGLVLAYTLHRLSKLATNNPESAGDLGQHLGVGLIVLSLVTMVLSLVTMNASLFILFMIVLLLPAGILAGTSAELQKGQTNT